MTRRSTLNAALTVGSVVSAVPAAPAASSARVILAATLLLGLAACASTPVPNEQMAVAAAAVAQASSAGTGAMAPDELRVAVDKLAKARAALAAGDHDRARRLAEQAELDAQVAEIQAQSARASVAAKESEDAARVLREEINRKTDRSTRS